MYVSTGGGSGKGNNYPQRQVNPNTANAPSAPQQYTNAIPMHPNAPMVIQGFHTQYVPQTNQIYQTAASHLRVSQSQMPPGFQFQYIFPPPPITTSQHPGNMVPNAAAAAAAAAVAAAGIPQNAGGTPSPMQCLGLIPPPHMGTTQQQLQSSGQQSMMAMQPQQSGPMLKFGDKRRERKHAIPIINPATNKNVLEEISSPSFGNSATAKGSATSQSNWKNSSEGKITNADEIEEANNAKNKSNDNLVNSTTATATETNYETSNTYEEITNNVVKTVAQEQPQKEQYQKQNIQQIDTTDNVSDTAEKGFVSKSLTDNVSPTFPKEDNQRQMESEKQQRDTKRSEVSYSETVQKKELTSSKVDDTQMRPTTEATEPKKEKPSTTDKSCSAEMASSSPVDKEYSVSKSSSNAEKPMLVKNTCDSTKFGSEMKDTDRKNEETATKEKTELPMQDYQQSQEQQGRRHHQQHQQSVDSPSIRTNIGGTNEKGQENVGQTGTNKKSRNPKRRKSQQHRDTVDFSGKDNRRRSVDEDKTSIVLNNIEEQDRKHSGGGKQSRLQYRSPSGVTSSPSSSQKNKRKEKATMISTSTETEKTILSGCSNNDNKKETKISSRQFESERAGKTRKEFEDREIEEEESVECSESSSKFQDVTPKISEKTIQDEETISCSSNADNADLSTNLSLKSLPSYIEYKEGQWSPHNKEGKKVYDLEQLKSLRKSHLSRMKPEIKPSLSSLIPLSSEINMKSAQQQQQQQQQQQSYKGNQFSFTNSGRVGMGIGGGSNNSNMQQSSASVLSGGGAGATGGGHSLQKSNSSGRLASGKTSNKGGIIHVRLSLKENVKLNESENAWKPSHMKFCEKIDRENSKERDELLRKVRGVLNKLTPEKFDLLVEEITSLQVDTCDKVNDVMMLVFEKAIDEPNFSESYARLCVKLTEKNPQMQQNENKSSNEGGTAASNLIVFKTALLDKTQREFFDNVINLREKELKLKPIIDKMKACSDPREKADLQSILEDQEYKLRQRSCGTVRFIGELWKIHMLTQNIIRTCIYKLLDAKSEQKLECLCKLLTTIGKHIDTVEKKGEKNFIDDVIRKMQDIVDRKTDTSKISNRVRFMLQDVIDLRKGRWITTHKESTIKSGHADSGQSGSDMGTGSGGYRSMSMKKHDNSKTSPGGGRGDGGSVGGGRNMGGDGGRMNTGSLRMSGQQDCHGSNEGGNQRTCDDAWNSSSKSGNRPIDTSKFGKIINTERPMKLGDSSQYQWKFFSNVKGLDSGKSSGISSSTLSSAIGSGSMSSIGGDGSTSSTTILKKPESSKRHTSEHSTVAVTAAVSFGTTKSEEENKHQQQQQKKSTSGGKCDDISLSSAKSANIPDTAYSSYLIQKSCSQRDLNSNLELSSPKKTHSDTSIQQNVDGEATSDSSLYGDIDISEEDKVHVKNILNDILDVANGESVESALLIWSELHKNLHWLFVYDILTDYLHLLHTKQFTRKLLSDIVSELLRSGKLNYNDFKIGYLEFLKICDEIIIDIPKAWVYVFEFIGPLIYKKLINVNILWNHFLEDSVKSNMAKQFLKDMLQYFIKEHGNDYVKNLWRSEKLEFKHFLKNEKEIRNFVKENDLSFLVITDSETSRYEQQLPIKFHTGKDTEKISSLPTPLSSPSSQAATSSTSSSKSTTKSRRHQTITTSSNNSNKSSSNNSNMKDVSFNIEDIMNNITKLLKSNSNNNIDEIFNYINEKKYNIDKDFIRYLTKILCDHAVIDNNISASNININNNRNDNNNHVHNDNNNNIYDLDREIFKRICCPILRRYIDSNEDFEFECLYAIHKFMLELKYPTNDLFCLIFNELYDASVIPKEAFIKWRDWMNNSKEKLILKRNPDMERFFNSLLAMDDETIGEIC